jgi:uncharacterized cupredoxin-like copper-binding protein
VSGPARRRISTALAAIAVGVIAAGCGSGADARTAADPYPSEHHGAAPSGTAADDGGALEVTASDFAFTAERSAIAAGPTRIRLTNEGRSPHQVQIGRLRGPMTPDDFIELFEEVGDRATVDALDWVGGVNAIDPGETGEAWVDLSPGEYLMVCYVPEDDGTSHVMKGMVGSLHVTDGRRDRGVVEPDERTESVVLRDYEIVIPAGFRGRGEVTFRNEGPDPHEVVLLRLEDGRTLADAAAYQADPTVPRPFTFAGGVGSVAPGTRAVATLDLRPGDYIATCLVPSSDGVPHIDLGMLTTFTIG